MYTSFIMADSFTASFLGAIQAALGVLLTIFYGVLAGQFGILDQRSTKQVSSLCVKVFLPALLLTNVGKELHVSTIQLYAPIIGMLHASLPNYADST